MAVCGLVGPHWLGWASPRTVQGRRRGGGRASAVEVRLLLLVGLQLWGERASIELMEVYRRPRLWEAY